jgi:hypothetical protein
LLSLLYGFIRGGKADDAYCGRNNHFRVGMRGDAFDSFGAEKYFESGLRGLPAPVMLLQSGAEFARAGLSGNRDHLRAVLRHLFGNQSDIRSRSQRYDFKSSRMRVDYFEALAADGACGAENRDLLHQALVYRRLQEYANGECDHFPDAALIDNRR